MLVEKRDGRVVQFKKNKIENAVIISFSQSKESVKRKDIDEIVDYVCSKIKTDKITVEEIQDLVEDALLRMGFERTFQEYATYRRKRTISRERIGINNSSLLKDIESIPGSASADLKRENANVDGNTPMGTMLQFGSTISKQYSEAYLLSNEAKNLHKSGDIHIHDLDFYPMGTTTCLQIDLEKLFKGGFSTGHGYLREPQSIHSYASLAAIAIQANQNDQHEI